LKDPSHSTAEAEDSRDDESLGLMAAEDRQAFLALYRRHVGRMFSYFAWRFGRSDAADLTSEVFLRALNSARRFEKGRSWAAWLYGIARNVASEHIRHGRRERAGIELADVTVSPDEELLQGQQEERVREAVSDLPELQREVVELRFWAGLSYREIAEVTGRSEAALRVQAHRALRQLKAKLEEEARYEDFAQEFRGSSAVGPDVVP
jgi:RNA polymerase sigma-70 factor (ECF subfamily)